MACQEHALVLVSQQPLPSVSLPGLCVQQTRAQEDETLSLVSPLRCRLWVQMLAQTVLWRLMRPEAQAGLPSLEGDSTARTALGREERRRIPLMAGACLEAVAVQALIRLLASAPSVLRVTEHALMSSRRLPQSARAGWASAAWPRLRLRAALRLHRSQAAALMASQEERRGPAMAAGFQGR